MLGLEVMALVNSGHWIRHLDIKKIDFPKGTRVLLWEMKVDPIRNDSSSRGALYKNRGATSYGNLPFTKHIWRQFILD